MQVCGLQKSTVIDYPGRPAATVFLCGCNLRCPWCYSRELVLPSEIEKQPKISQDEFFNFLKERQGFLEGVVICGGEPTINQDLPDFIKKIKDLGFLVKLDTNGSNPQMLENLLDEKLVDYVALDVKLPKEKYREILKIDPAEIEKSIRLLKKSWVEHEFRTTVVPNVHTKEDIVKIAQWLTPARRYYLQNFRPEKTVDPEFNRIKAFSDEELAEMQESASKFFETCQVR